MNPHTYRPTPSYAGGVHALGQPPMYIQPVGCGACAVVAGPLGGVGDSDLNPMNWKWMSKEGLARLALVGGGSMVAAAMAAMAGAEGESAMLATPIGWLAGWFLGAKFMPLKPTGGSASAGPTWNPTIPANQFPAVTNKEGVITQAWSWGS